MLVFTDLIMHLYVDQTERTGKGIFAGENIKNGDLILKFKGKVIKDKYDSEGYGDYVKERWVGIGKETWVELDKSDPLIFTNHSCNPNALIKNKTELYSLRDIKIGEEITFDYATTESNTPENKWKMECKCGSKNCRKTIVGTTNF